MRVRWYFDFISPFSYLQSERLPEFAAHATIDYVPVLFAGLLKHWGHTGPAELAPKREFTYRHVLWMARRDGIPLRMPPAHPFSSLSALRLAIALGGEPAVIHAIFRFTWAEGHRTDDAADWSALCERLRVSDADERIARDEVREALRANTGHAINRNVFGVPTLEVGDELFWGYDATDMALAYLQDPQTFDDEQMRRAATLPEGVQRSRG